VGEGEAEFADSGPVEPRLFCIAAIQSAEGWPWIPIQVTDNIRFD
jgi:hypothetical protein